MFSSGAWITTSAYEDQEAPKAFLNYLLFDDNFNLLDAGFDQVGQAGATTHDYMSLQVRVKQTGYLYIYLSNESDKIVDVYFDDFRITHHAGVASSNDYYPFGLTFNSRHMEKRTFSPYQYNGKEMQDELNLGWFDYGARMYMPDLGRWGTIDPLADKFEIVTPYNYAFNNPILFVDPDGRENVIYLIAAGDFSFDELKKIAGIINGMFEKLKLETRAVAFDEKERGQFLEGETDDNDNWAVIGTDRKAIAEKAKSITSDPTYAKEIDGWQDKNPNTIHPEQSNTTIGGKGIVVDYNDNISGAYVRKNKREEAGLAIIHGAGHSSSWVQSTSPRTGPGKNIRGHTDFGVMQQGDELGRQYRESGLIGILGQAGEGQIINGNSFYGDETYRLGIMGRYGRNPSSDNYGKKRRK